MKKDKEVPFYSNTPDKTHCYQACLKMLLGFYWPEEKYSWEKLDRVTEKIEGLWTWPMAGMIYLQSKGLKTISISHFDYDRFLEIGGEYLIEKSGEAVGKKQIANSNIKKAQKEVDIFLKTIEVENRIPELQEIIDLLKKDYLLICNLNLKALNEKAGFSGHFVLVKGFENNELIIHDPGPPANENRRVSFELFEKAWAFPNKKAKNIKAFKPVT